MITTANRKELLSRAYVEAVAACCGMSLCSPYPDYGVDIVLHKVAVLRTAANGRKKYTQTGYPLEVQLKSTVTARVDENQVTFDLDSIA